VILPLAAAPRGLWYLTRGLGTVTLVLLTLSVALGILDAQRFSIRPKLPRFVVDGLHRNISLLVLVVLALHVMTSVVDTFAPINLIDAFVPFVSHYRPVWLGLGAIALDLLIAVAVTSLVRARLGFRAWRAVHWLAYACWPVALVHGFGTGSDAKQGWMLVLSAACVAVVLGAIAWRATSGWPARRGIRTAALSATVAAPIALVAWLSTGPLASGWARRSGTPPSVLAAVGAGTTKPASSAPSATFRAPFSANLSGTAAQRTVNDGDTAEVSIQATMSGGQSGRLNVTIAGTPLDNGGVSMTSSQVSLGPANQPELYRGRITSLEGTRLNARVSNGSGGTIDLRADLNIEPSGSVTGTLEAAGGAAQ
jgi:DMSO/TMAO reductase YedYZ heme-binding membrane subunit